MKAKISILSLLFLFTHNAFTQDLIYATVADDSVTIHHDETERNCGSLYMMGFEIDGNNIAIYETDTGFYAFCMCYFDLSLSINDLTSGDYQVDIYSIENYTPDTIYWGSTSFSIAGSGSGNPQITSNYQSYCYSPCPPPQVELALECYEFTLGFGNGQKEILGYNIYRDGELLGFHNGPGYYTDILGPGAGQICVTSVCDECESETVCFDYDIPYGDPPENLEATGTGYGALLTWDAPDGYLKSLLGYKVYRDFELFIPDPISDTFYLNTSIEINTLYHYYITAAYDDCESLPTDTFEVYAIGSGANNLNSEEVLIYPNPVKDYLHINSEAEIAGIQIYDLLGKIVFESGKAGNEAKLNLSHLQSGMYFIKVQNDNAIITRKLWVK